MGTSAAHLEKFVAVGGGGHGTVLYIDESHVLSQCVYLKIFSRLAGALDGLLYLRQSSRGSRGEGETGVT